MSLFDAQAAGLGHTQIVDDIVSRSPHAVSSMDSEGRTPLHYAAIVRDGGEVYNKLVRAGADELAQDHVSYKPINRGTFMYVSRT